MNEQDKALFSELLNTATTLYKTEPLTMAVKKLWWELLVDKTMGEVSAAMTKHAGTVQFMPKPADLLNIIRADRRTGAHVTFDEQHRLEKDSGMVGRLLKGKVIDETGMSSIAKREMAKCVAILAGDKEVAAQALLDFPLAKGKN